MASRREPPTRMASGLRAPSAASTTRTRTSTRMSSIRQPVASRFARDGAISPAESLASVATTGLKRKDRDFDSESIPVVEETNINVVVRCRGRNEREVRENSAVVIQADGVRGKLLELKMGSNALNDKTYNFDRVFSQAADQSMVFDDVVKPILDEMLAGFNCTILAYGQTGTGKTYTMSGDMTETMGLLSDEAGIIPRVLRSLFNKLETDDTENCVKCSFIELYNEEVRDLISVDEHAKLKIFDDTSRKGHTTTVVQGMEEKHIKTAIEGIRVLQEGSLKRQVAATKCNDLSSRSHTVFTITTYVRKKSEAGATEEFVCSGKLNLVDLAGSENIQRSGAENKRAAEAGLINKSLLTLGRVINALVDRSNHIPYRESKLTRLLQDSLGGRTKTCMIATISPSKSNLEETISTLDYAFRAKNIRNKPQLNAPINKKMLLRDFAIEIEKLKSELITTRQRNGVYLSNESYEEMTTQSESRRIVLEEQNAKLETLETNLKNKVQELFQLISAFTGLKKDHEGTKAQLDDTKEVLDQTELVLSATRKSLADETHLRKAHQATEAKLTEVGTELISTIQKTVHDVDGLRAKSKRKSDLQAINRSAWGMAQSQVADITTLVEQRIESFQDEQQRHIAEVSQRMGHFVQGELSKLTSTQTFLEAQLQKFDESKQELLEGKDTSKAEMDEVLEEIKAIRDAVKEQVGNSLQTIAEAADQIAADVLSELSTFHSHLHTSYATLGKDFKTVFDDLVKQITHQKAESDRLRLDLRQATEAIVDENARISTRMTKVLEEEKKQAASDRQTLLSQITALVNAQAETQEKRLGEKSAMIQESMTSSNATLESTLKAYEDGMDSWNERESELLDKVAKSKETMKTKLQDDWAAANEHSTSIQDTTKSVNAETMRVVDEQLKNLEVQMEALDEFVTRARSENATQHDKQAEYMESLSATVVASFDNISNHFVETFDRVKYLGSEMETLTAQAEQNLEPLDENLREPLGDLRDEIMETKIKEYQPTGDTPMKIQYQYPTDLPRTKPHQRLLADLNGCASPSKSDSVPTVLPDLSSPSSSPLPQVSVSDQSHTIANPLNMSLREVNPNLTSNLTTGSLLFESITSSLPDTSDNTEPLFKRPLPKLSKTSGRKTHNVLLPLEGRENELPTAVFSQSLGPKRKSPRLN
ncbi:kinesin motor domain-containing protein [Plectosphaerella plurivora]|uniref:Kinesin motor domain-containing protein n=1 Tax=Plectosphaerella plurivora TaxID=936078 RepID=A0A9P9AF72_9PEZI|nr:kinesin motor domain-containing protein [Plectosphaerella plurivora]